MWYVVLPVRMQQSDARGNDRALPGTKWTGGDLRYGGGLDLPMDRDTVVKCEYVGVTFSRSLQEVDWEQVLYLLLPCHANTHPNFR